MKSKNSVDRIYQLRQLFLENPESSKQRNKKLPRKLERNKLNNLNQNQAA